MDAHRYHLDESTLILGASGVFLEFYSILFFNEISLSKQNSPRWDAALFCLPMSHKRDATAEAEGEVMAM